MVASLTPYCSSIGHTVCPDTSSLAHFFGARQVIYPGTNPLIYSFDTEWIAGPDASPITAHLSIDSRVESGLLKC